MFLALSLCTAIAGVTGAASITRWFTVALHGAQNKSEGPTANSSSSIEFPGAVETADCLRPPGASPQLINSLLDDVEISLRSLRREKPGPSRSCKVMDMVNRYSPTPQPQGHHIRDRDMTSVHAYVGAMARAKAAPLLAEGVRSAHQAAQA